MKHELIKKGDCPKIDWELDEDYEDGDLLHYGASGKIVDTNGSSIGWSASARPKRHSNLYIGQINMRIGFALAAIARQDDFPNVQSAVNFVECQFANICSQFDGLVKSQMQKILLEIIIKK